MSCQYDNARYESHGHVNANRRDGLKSYGVSSDEEPMPKLGVGLCTRERRMCYITDSDNVGTAGGVWLLWVSRERDVPCVWHKHTRTGWSAFPIKVSSHPLSLPVPDSGGVRDGTYLISQAELGLPRLRPMETKPFFSSSTLTPSFPLAFLPHPTSFVFNVDVFPYCLLSARSRVIARGRVKDIEKGKGYVIPSMLTSSFFILILEQHTAKEIALRLLRAAF